MSLPERGKPEGGDLAHEILLIDGLRVAMGLALSPFALPDDFDFMQLLESSDSEGLTPYVFEALVSRRALSSMDDEVKEIWQKTTDLYASRYYWRKSQLPEVRALFESMNLEFIFLKGASFAFELYDKPFRDMNDFDILVREPDVLTAHAGLERAGLRPLTHPSRFRGHSRLELVQLRRGGVVSFGRHLYETQGLSIDLHWRIGYPVGTEPLELVSSELWRKAIGLGGPRGELSREHQFLVVLAHAASSPKQKLSHWLDVVMLRRHLGPGFDVREFLRTTKALATSEQGRMTLADRFESVWDTIHSIPESPRWSGAGRPVAAEGFRGPTLIEYWKWRRSHLAFLGFSERVLYFLGFCLPSREYYRGVPLLQSLLSFYGLFWLGVYRMLERIVSAIGALIAR